MEQRIGKPGLNIHTILITITIDFHVSVDLFGVVTQSPCLKLHVMNQLSQEQHTSPISLLKKPYEFHLTALPSCTAVPYPTPSVPSSPYSVSIVEC